MRHRVLQSGIILAMTGMVVACGATNPPTISEGHITSSDEAAAEKALIPQPVTQVPALPRPGQRKKLETYTVVVNQVPIRELLFSMARDADLNLDIDNDISGKITMNAIDQTLPMILDRIEAQAGIIYFLKDGTLRVKAVNYLNISRKSTGKVSVSTEIGATASGIRNSGGGGSGGSGSSGSSGGSGSGKNKATMSSGRPSH